jgi:DNA-binding Lrp family transcriptional regulator
MNAYNFPQFDALDMRIMEELELDARQTYKDLAAKLGVSRPTVMSRTQQLFKTGVLKTICWVDPITLGYKFNVAFFISSDAGRVSVTLDRLAASKQVVAAYLCTGRFDITALCLFRERKDLANFFLNELGSIPGIGHVEKIVLIQQVKAATTWLTDQKETSCHENPVKQPVDLDYPDVVLIRELQTNARQNISDLAQKLGVSKPTIYKKIQRLIRKDIIQIRTHIDPFALGYDGVATIGVKCDPAKVQEVANAVASYKQVHYVAISAGRYDILTWVVFRTLSDLKHFTSELGSIPGLKDIETMIHYKMFKMLAPFPSNES